MHVNASQRNELMPKQTKNPATPRNAKASGASPAATIDFTPLEAWFVTGSQHLYGPETLAQVEAEARQSRRRGLKRRRPADQARLQAGRHDPGRDQTRSSRGQRRARTASASSTWMHTFSPAKMWIGGLTRLTKPLCHLHTQFDRDIPWSSIDMDFMNLNQSAHGDREFGFIVRAAAHRPQGDRRPLAGEGRRRLAIGVWTACRRRRGTTCST